MAKNDSRTTRSKGGSRTGRSGTAAANPRAKTKGTSKAKPSNAKTRPKAKSKAKSKSKGRRKSPSPVDRRTSFLDVQGPRTGNPNTQQNILVALAILVVFGALCYGAWMGMTRVQGSVYSQNPRYAMLQQNHTFETSPGGVINQQRFFQLADLNPAANLFGFDLGSLRKKILENPAVEDIRIKREVTSRSLSISLQERMPIARLDNNFVVDSNGHVIRRILRGSDLRLPLIDNLNSPNKNVGRDLSNSLAKDAIDVLNVLRHRETAYLGRMLPVETIDVSNGANLTVILEGGFKIHFPREHPTHYLDRSAHALEVVQGRRERNPRWKGVSEFDWTHGKLIVK